ncbi:MAG: CAP domain-containing protein [Actinomycetota bacterium]|nr:CAP domain-containing protein [Actinomycetota bacterium]
MRRLFLAISSILICLGALTSAGLAWATDGSAAQAESEFQTKINQERGSAGLAALVFDAGLIDVARKHSSDMASANKIYHDENLPNEVSGWIRLGENVGRGQLVDDIHKAFMSSPTHRDQILDSRYIGFAVGVVTTSSDMFVTELFITRENSDPPVRLASRRVSHQRPTRATSAARAIAPIESQPVQVAAAEFPAPDPLMGSALDTENVVLAESPSILMTRPLGYLLPGPVRGPAGAASVCLFLLMVGYAYKASIRISRSRL